MYQRFTCTLVFIFLCLDVDREYMSEWVTHTHWMTSSEKRHVDGSSDAYFPYWSFTKTVISICALKLVEDGILSLDAELPDAPYTLRQLLHHSSGLPDYGQFPEYAAAVKANERPWPRDAMLKLALSKGMLFKPDQGWSYSNIGYMYVRELVEGASQRSLGTVISELISNPLGLESVEFAQSREQFSRLYWSAAASYDPQWVYHGCLIGTVVDAVKLLHALFMGELLRPETLGLMTETKILGGPIAGRPWSQRGYALGLMSGTVDGLGKVIGHSGSGPFSVNAVYHFPDLCDPVTVACFSGGSDEGVAENVAIEIAAAKKLHSQKNE